MTKELFQELRKSRDRFQLDLVTGMTLCPEPGQTCQQTARLVGVLYGIDLVLEMRMDQEEG